MDAGRAPIYLDYNASTPVAPEVAAAMRPWIAGRFGNPSSLHWAAADAREAIATARRCVADLLGCAVDEIVFTSGGSEANNLALKGLFFRAPGRARHVITSAIEHPAILEPCRFLERLGAEVTLLPVDGTGLVDPADVRRAITRDTFLITIMHANNEVGTIQPIEQIGQIAREYGVPLHTDAAQSVGKVATNVARLGASLLSVAGHKLYAPKGIGALYVAEGITLEPLVHGAGHERGRRAGTESAMLIAALGAAAKLAQSSLGMPRVLRLRDLLWERLMEEFGSRVVLNGHPELRLPNTLSVSFVGCVAAEILARMPEVAASTGSACHSGSVELSPVLRAMGIRPEVGMGAIRFSLGRTTTADEIERVVTSLKNVLVEAEGRL